jgi:hypothetical protein
MSETLMTTPTPPIVAPAATAQPVLQVVGGNKIYGGVHAIEAINFDLYPGEVHARSLPASAWSIRRPAWCRP